MTLLGADRFYSNEDLALAQELADRGALAVQNARLYEQSQRAIRTRDDFLSIASHELRTPLTSLKLVVQGLRHRQVPPSLEKLERAVSLADRQITKLGRLVDELLDVSRIQSDQLRIELEQVDLVALVREVATSFAADLAQARCQLELRGSTPVVGFWDRDKLEHVVANLLSNAAKFGAGQPIEITVEDHAGTARLVVTDYGIGIETTCLQSIFEKFERAVSARSYGGLGLGLYITRIIAEALGGTVTAQSPGLGKGATFTVELPCAGPARTT
jgi:signal transduction histidine kinase